MDPKKKLHPRLRLPRPGDEENPMRLRIRRGRDFRQSNVGKQMSKELRKIRVNVKRLERHNRILETAGGAQHAININRDKIIQMGNRTQTLENYKRQFIETGIHMSYPAYPTAQQFIVFL